MRRVDGDRPGQDPDEDDGSDNEGESDKPERPERDRDSNNDDDKDKKKKEKEEDPEVLRNDGTGGIEGLENAPESAQEVLNDAGLGEDLGGHSGPSSGEVPAGSPNPEEDPYLLGEPNYELILEGMYELGEAAIQASLGVGFIGAPTGVSQVVGAAMVVDAIADGALAVGQIIDGAMGVQDSQIPTDLLGDVTTKITGDEYAGELIEELTDFISSNY